MKKVTTYGQCIESVKGKDVKWYNVNEAPQGISTALGLVIIPRTEIKEKRHER